LCIYIVLGTVYIQSSERPRGTTMKRTARQLTEVTIADF